MSSTRILGYTCATNASFRFGMLGALSSNGGRQPTLSQLLLHALLYAAARHSTLSNFEQMFTDLDCAFHCVHDLCLRNVCFPPYVSAHSTASFYMMATAARAGLIREVSGSLLQFSCSN